MLKIKTLKVVFLLLFLVINVLTFFISVHYIYYIIWFVLFLSFLVYGSFFVNSNFYIRTICSTDNNNKEIAFTFDDGPVREITPAVLKLLNEFNIKATFFCIGEKIKSNRDILKQIDAEGHIVGNHTFFHSNYFDFYTSKRMKKELEDTEKVIYETIGKRVRFFRPPYGVTNPALKKAVQHFNYLVIGWSNRSLDTKSKNEKKILKRITKRLRPGDIILFHDLNPAIINVLSEFIKYALYKDFKIVRLDQLLKTDAYENS